MFCTILQHNREHNLKLRHEGKVGELCFGWIRQKHPETREKERVITNLWKYQNQHNANVCKCRQNKWSFHFILSLYFEFSCCSLSQCVSQIHTCIPCIPITLFQFHSKWFLICQVWEKTFTLYTIIRLLRAFLWFTVHRPNASFCEWLLLMFFFFFIYFYVIAGLNSYSWFSGDSESSDLRRALRHCGNLNYLPREYYTESEYRKHNT